MKRKNKSENAYKLEVKMDYSGKSALELEQVFKGPPKDAIILSLTANINSCDENSYFSIKYGIPIVTDDIIPHEYEVEDYEITSIHRRWNIAGELVQAYGSID